MRVSSRALGAANLTQAQLDAEYAALPWYIKPFATAEGAIQSAYCYFNPSDPACVTNLYTPAVAQATAPGVPVGYQAACTDPADPTSCSSSVDPTNETGATQIAGNYGTAIAAALPPPSTGLSIPNPFSIPSSVWVALAVVGGLILLATVGPDLLPAAASRKRK